MVKGAAKSSQGGTSKTAKSESGVKGKGKAKSAAAPATGGSKKKATYDMMVQEAISSRKGCYIIDIKKKIKSDYGIEPNATAIKSAIKKGIEDGSILKEEGGCYTFMSKERQAYQGKTWVTFAFSSGSGCVPMFTIFQKQTDILFFNGKDSYGAPPRSYSDNNGLAVRLPVLTLEEAQNIAKPLLKHKTEEDESKSVLVCKKYKNFIVKMHNEDQSKKQLELEVPDKGTTCGLGVVVLQCGGDPDYSMPLIVNDDDEAALRAFIGSPPEGGAWCFYDSEDCGASYLTRKYMDANAENIDELYEMVKREPTDYRPPGVL